MTVLSSPDDDYERQDTSTAVGEKRMRGGIVGDDGERRETSIYGKRKAEKKRVYNKRLDDVPGGSACPDCKVSPRAASRGI